LQQLLYKLLSIYIENLVLLFVNYQKLGFIFLTGTKKPLGRGLEGPYEGL